MSAFIVHRLNVMRLQDRDVQAPLDIFQRTYHSLLRSSGEIQIQALVEPYLAFEPALHHGAADPRPDLDALTYTSLRLPAFIDSVRLVLLGQSHEVFDRSGRGDVTDWQPVSAPGRRRKMFFDGDETLAVLIASPSDLDDLIPMLVAFQIEWNKLHTLLDDSAARPERAMPAPDVEHALVERWTRRVGYSPPAHDLGHGAAGAARKHCPSPQALRRAHAGRLADGLRARDAALVVAHRGFAAAAALARPAGVFCLQQHPQPGQPSFGLRAAQLGRAARLHPHARASAACWPSTRASSPSRCRPRSRTSSITLRKSTRPTPPARGISSVVLPKRPTWASIASPAAFIWMLTPR